MRDSQNGRCPMEVAQLLLGEEFLNNLGRERIPPDAVHLKPGLLKLQDLQFDTSVWTKYFPQLW